MNMRNLSNFDKAYIKTDRQIHKQSKQIQLPLILKQIFNRNIYKKQINMINDASNTIPKSLSRFERLCGLLQRNIPTIHPRQITILLWNMLMVFIIIVNFIEIPIDLLMIEYINVVKQQQLIYKIANAIMVGLLGIDFFFIRFRVSYYYHQILVRKYEIMLRKYLKKEFIIDFIALLVYFIDIIKLGTASYGKLLFFLKIYTLIKLNKQIEFRLLFHKYSLAFYKFLKMVAFIFCLTNINACIYFAMDFYHYSLQNFYYENGYLWLSGSSTTDYMDLIQTFDWYVWYIYALYWSVQTSATVGYGNMTPRNPQEVFFCNVVMLLTVCIFILFADRVIEIIQELQQNRQTEQEVLLNLRYFKNMNPMNKEMNNKVQFFAQSYGKLQSQEVQKLSTELLSDSLYNSFILQIQTPIFDNISILHDITHTKTVIKNKFARQVISSVKISFLSTNDILAEKDYKEDFKLYFISCGKISVFNDSTNNYKDYAKFDYVGQDNFFFGGITKGNIKCKTFTKVFHIQRNDFLNVLKNYPQENEKLKQQIDLVKLDKKQTKGFDITCFYCDQCHLTQNCSICQFRRDKIPNKQAEPKESYYISNDRVSYQRKKVGRFKICNKFRFQTLNIQTFRNTSHYFVINNLPLSGNV